MNRPGTPEPASWKKVVGFAILVENRAEERPSAIRLLAIEPRILAAGYHEGMATVTPTTRFADVASARCWTARSLCVSQRHDRTKTPSDPQMKLVFIAEADVMCWEGSSHTQ